MFFEILSEITEIKKIAAGPGIREIKRLRKQFGHGRWGKLKGVANVKLPSGRIRRVELHWYEAHGNRQ
jgi:hypothetical protein